MLFSKKKKTKLDPKIRFQNRQFNQKLHEARSFKRNVRQVPESEFARFLAAIGLGSIWRQMFVIFAVGGIAYLVYFPNFLTWHTVSVSGLADTEQALAQDAITNSLLSAPFYNPQKNMLFVSKERIAEAAFQSSAVDEIISIKKDFKNKVINIHIKAKHERFLVRTPESVLDVYNDGTIKGQAGIKLDSWPTTFNPQMLKLDVPGKIVDNGAKEFLVSNSVVYLDEISTAVKGITGSTLSHIKIVLPEVRQPAPPEVTEESEDAIVEEDKSSDESENEEVSEPTNDQFPIAYPEVTLPLKADEIELVFQKGNTQRTFRVIVDANEKPAELVDRLNLLLSQTAPDRYNQLSYIDMRIKIRAFVCLINAPCN
jgi:hypothetical protein